MAPRSEARVLTIGNSFTDSLRRYFPAVAASAGCALRLEAASFGGCELRRHWAYVQAEERDPDCRIYHGGGNTLARILAAEPWDFVTIQQASHESWRPETFQPYAGNLVAYIRAHAPGAEVLMQQTWSYHPDDPRLRPGGDWGIDPAEMHTRLDANYRAAAGELGLRLIPTGHAVRLSRAERPDRFHAPEALAALEPPDLPPMAGALVGHYEWGKDPADGRLALRSDLIHLNRRGEYLQACAWFAFLFGRPAADIAFVPDELGADEAARLRRIAQKAVDTYPPV